jgi:sugar phosphate isomerase/epimerase
MKISCCWLYAISKYGYPPAIENLFKALTEMAEMGFKYVELEGVREENLMAVYKNREEIKRHCDRLKIKVINFCPVIPDIVSLDEDKREKAKELFNVGIELAKYFECETIQIDSFTPPLEFLGDTPYKESISFGKHFKIKIDPEFDWDRLWNVLVDSFKFTSKLAKEAGLKFCLEPRVGELISNTDAILRLMDWVKMDNFGAVLDTGHLNAQKELVPLSVEKLKDKISFLHVSDNDGKTNDHLPLGKGNIDWEGLFLTLKKHNYQGYVAIDIGNVPDIENAYIGSKKFLEELSKNLGL